MDSQQIQSKLSPGEEKAALGIATRISEQVFKQKNPPKEKEKSNIEEPQDLEKMKSDILSVVDEKISSLTELIKSALEDESKGETKENT